MNWDYAIIAIAIAVALIYLVWRHTLRKSMRTACACSASDCACCRQASGQRLGGRNDG